MRENILPSTVMRAFQALRYIHLRYFALVTKINKKGKAQERVIVLTELHLYSCTKEDGSIKRCLKLSDITKVITCRNRSEVALVVRENGGDAQYDLLFQAHSLVALEEFLKHIPKDVEVKDVAMSLLGNHNGSDCNLHLEKPRGYSRDVADAVKWKVSSWTTLSAPGPSGSANRSSAANTASSKDISGAAAPSSSTLQRKTSLGSSGSTPPTASPATANLISEDSERMSTRTTTSTVIGKQIPTAAGIANRLASMISFDDDDDDNVEDVNDVSQTHGAMDDGGDDEGASTHGVTTRRAQRRHVDTTASSSGGLSPPGSPIGRLLSPDMTAGDRRDMMEYSLDHDGSEDGVEDTPLYRRNAQFDDDDDDDETVGSDLDVVYDRIHPKRAVTAQGVPGSPSKGAPSLLETVAASATRRQGSPQASPPSPSLSTSNQARRANGESSPHKVTILPVHMPSHHNAHLSLSSPMVSSSDHTSELMSLLHEERTKFASQILLTSELLSVERENGAVLRRIVDDLRLEVEQLTFENMMLKRSGDDL